jgi:hypothetical protein
LSLCAALLGCAREPAQVPVVIAAPPPAPAGEPSAASRKETRVRHLLPAACAPEDVFQEAEIRRAISPDHPHGPMEVLVWLRTKDARPWAVDEAVVWFRRTDHGHKLVSVYRNPHLPGPEGTAWRLRKVYDVKFFRNKADFDHLPTSVEVLAFLHDTMWRWYLWDETVLGSGVCTETWQRLTGEPVPPSL